MTKREEKILTSKIDFEKGTWERVYEENRKEQTCDIRSINSLQKLLKGDLLELAEQLLCNVNKDNTKQQIIEAIQNKIKKD